VRGRGHIHATAENLGIVREYGGHGIGRALHEDPFIPNFGRPGRGPDLRPGLVIAVEPMLNMGRAGVTVPDLERKLAEAWDNSCEALIDAHFDAAEGYEHAQLIAEVAIIIASLAILMSSRVAWLASVVIGLLCLGQIGYTFASSRAAIHEHHDKVHHAQEAFEELIEKHLDTAEDEATVNDLDPGGNIRSSIQKDSMKEPAKPETHAEAKHD
jgi:hypothetical protein